MSGGGLRAVLLVSVLAAAQCGATYTQELAQFAEPFKAGGSQFTSRSGVLGQIPITPGTGALTPMQAKDAGIAPSPVVFLMPLSSPSPSFGTPVPTSAPTYKPTSAPTVAPSSAPTHAPTVNGFHYDGFFVQFVRARGRMNAANIRKACAVAGMMPVCDHPVYYDGKCVLLQKYAHHWHFSHPHHDRSHGLSPSRLSGVFYYTGRHHTGSLYNNGHSHRWMNGGDKNGKTACVEKPKGFGTLKYKHYKMKRVFVRGRMNRDNIRKACKAQGLRPVCDHSAYYDGRCVNTHGGWHLSHPHHDRHHGVDVRAAVGAFFYTGRHGSGALKNTGNSHRWSNGHDRDMDTFCVRRPPGWQNFVYRGMKMKRVRVHGYMDNNNLRKTCARHGMRPLCDNMHYADNRCSNIGGHWHFSHPSHDRSHGVPLRKVEGVFFYAGHHHWSLQNTGSTHRWASHYDRDGETFCTKVKGRTVRNKCFRSYQSNPGYSRCKASSVWGNDRIGWRHGAGRLHSGQGWSARHNHRGEWWQIDAGRMVPVSGIYTQRRRGSSQRVTQYKVKLSRDGVYWTWVDGGRVFNGNHHNNEGVVTGSFRHPVRARFVRIIAWHWSHHISMRASLRLGRHCHGISDVKRGTRDEASMAQRLWHSSGAHFHNGIITVNSGSAYVQTRKSYNRPVDVEAQIRQTHGGYECGVLALFPQNGHRHSGYNAGVGWWRHYFGAGVDGHIGRHGHSGNIRHHWRRVRINARSDGYVDFYMDGHLRYRVKDNKYHHGPVRFGKSCRQFQIRKLTVRGGNSARVRLVSQGRPTRQGSEGWGGRSSRAVDGNTNGHYGHRSCTHTHAHNAWWRVDLARHYRIQKVVIWNRADCCQSRLNNVRIMADGHHCGDIGHAHRVNTINCHYRRGKHIYVKQRRHDYLTLCEVRVYGK